jgi:hypothetical protein
MFHWYRWLDEIHSGQGPKPKSAGLLFGCTASVGPRCPPNSHSLVIVLSSHFRFQVSINHVVDAMASSLVEDKSDSVKHLLVLINHSHQRRTRWKIRGMIRLELRR